MVWCDRIVWGTWFTASPAWIYGIQWIPSGPHGAFYDRDRGFIRKTYADVERELKTFEEKEAAKKPDSKPKPVAFESLGGELGSYHLGFLMHADAPYVVSELDRLWATPDDKVAHDPWMASIYYQASKLAQIGRVDFTAHGNSPTSMVYANDVTKTRTLIGWNPTAATQTVKFFEGSKTIGTVEVAPHSIASAEVKQ
jgi:hypothetical protein